VSVPSLVLARDGPLSRAAVSERGGEGVRRLPVLGCTRDGGRRGEARSGRWGMAWRGAGMRHRGRSLGVPAWRSAGHRGCGDKKKLRK
jgi:hypothetical protein